jgi:hypothetical protein
LSFSKRNQSGYHSGNQIYPRSWFYSFASSRVLLMTCRASRRNTRHLRAPARYQPRNLAPKRWQNLGRRPAAHASWSTRESIQIRAVTSIIHRVPLLRSSQTKAEDCRHTAPTHRWPWASLDSAWPLTCASLIAASGQTIYRRASNATVRAHIPTSQHKLWVSWRVSPPLLINQWDLFQNLCLNYQWSMDYTVFSSMCLIYV